LVQKNLRWKLFSKLPVYQFSTHASLEKSTAAVTSQNSIMLSRRSVATNNTAKTCTLSATFRSVKIIFLSLTFKSPLDQTHTTLVLEKSKKKQATQIFIPVGEPYPCGINVGWGDLDSSFEETMDWWWSGVNVCCDIPPPPEEGGEPPAEPVLPPLLLLLLVVSEIGMEGVEVRCWWWWLWWWWCCWWALFDWSREIE